MNLWLTSVPIKLVSCTYAYIRTYVHKTLRFSRDASGNYFTTIKYTDSSVRTLSDNFSTLFSRRPLFRVCSRLPEECKRRAMRMCVDSCHRDISEPTTINTWRFYWVCPPCSYNRKQTARNCILAGNVLSHLYNIVLHLVCFPETVCSVLATVDIQQAQFPYQVLVYGIYAVM